MIYFANPAGDDVRDAMAAGRLGCMVTPGQGNTTFPDDGWDLVADNGCFSGTWTHRKWIDWLINIPRSIRFAVAPDVFDPTGAPCHDQTLERWATYGPLIERLGFTPAFVCQVGATPETVPPEAAVLFLGGTTEWKLGPQAWAIAADAHERGVWTHMGRVNSKKRLDIARSMRCDSADGTYLVFGPDKNLPKLLAWLDEADTNPMLWETP